MKRWLACCMVVLLLCAVGCDDDKQIAHIRENSTASAEEGSTIKTEEPVLGFDTEPEEKTATGLYVDGELVGVMESRNELEDLLNELLQPAANQGEENQTISFLQTVECKDGAYPADALIQKEQMSALLRADRTATIMYTIQEGDTLSVIAEKFSMTTAELREENDLAETDDALLNVGETLRVWVKWMAVKTTTTYDETEVIDYKTIYEHRDDRYTDERKVTVEGRAGECVVTMEETWVDGKLINRQEVKRATTKEAVDKVVEIGTKERPIIDGVQSEKGGTMQWPAPICHNVSQGFSSTHKGISISNGEVPVYGHPAIAADGGTVEYAGWNYDYGYQVRVNHGNGIVTTYSHLSGVEVLKGQKISRGQTVGLIGNTGNSQGPHLYFEVIINGVHVDPLRYVSP